MLGLQSLHLHSSQQKEGRAGKRHISLLLRMLPSHTSAYSSLARTQPHSCTKLTGEGEKGSALAETNAFIELGFCDQGGMNVGETASSLCHALASETLTSVGPWKCAGVD